MSDQSGEPRQLTEEDLRNMSEEELQELYIQQYNNEMKQIHVEDLIAQTIVTLVNLGGRRAGLVPGTEDERDPAQLQTAIDAARALLPYVKAALGDNAPQIEDALSQLQMAFVQMQKGADGAAAGGLDDEQQPSSGPGPAQSSGRLWVPGQ